MGLCEGSVGQRRRSVGQGGGIYRAQWGGGDLPTRGNVSPRRNTCHLLDDKVDTVFGDCCQTPPSLRPLPAPRRLTGDEITISPPLSGRVPI